MVFSLIFKKLIKELEEVVIFQVRISGLDVSGDGYRVFGVDASGGWWSKFGRISKYFRGDKVKVAEAMIRLDVEIERKISDVAYGADQIGSC